MSAINIEFELEFIFKCKCQHDLGKVNYFYEVLNIKNNNFSKLSQNLYRYIFF